MALKDRNFIVLYNNVRTSRSFTYKNSFRQKKWSITESKVETIF